jgi:L-ascorbate metabolism protein UlaG (beta-lactamase superfamily)/glycosyltransferase involved in cell wall biosynthesis
MNNMKIQLQLLGQSGCRFEFPGVIVYVDLYLSNSVKEIDDPYLERLVPVEIEPCEIFDANIVLITHKHTDHCDPRTVPQIAMASPHAKFMGPAPVIAILRQWGIAPSRLILASESGVELTPEFSVHAVPAAHPEIERDENGNLAAVGYILNYAGQKIYLAGDTFARQIIIDVVNSHAPIHTAFLPVNEHNFFRARRGIIGNMSVREAFLFAQEIGVKQVVAVHWDMFAINAVDSEEINFIYQRMDPGFKLLLRPSVINLGDVRISIVVRTLNEGRYLDELLTVIAAQKNDGIKYEVILVDSGSTDGTLKIAARHGCHVLQIKREEFSFGRSLNIGCEAAQGAILVMISGHCVPTDEYWLQRLCRPIIEGQAEYVYGRQIGGPECHFSEQRIFAKYFSVQSQIPQDGFYCNNANSALARSSWEKYRFDEDLTGLEDMDLAHRLVKDGGKVAYVAEAEVYHHHNETWAQVRRRFERESIALQKIMPQVHINIFDAIYCTLTSIVKDFKFAQKGKFRHSYLDIIRYRFGQYSGVYNGNRQHCKLSRADKEKYFYPE